MTDLRQAAQQALADLRDLHANHNITYAGTIAALEAALAQQAEPAEPVATLHDDGYFTWKRDEFRRLYEKHRIGWRMDVFAAPPQRKPLTDEEINEIAQTNLGDYRDGEWHLLFARAVERAHGIKENAND